MPYMKIHQESEGTILGPCPGCEVWTIQYDRDIVVLFTSDEFAATVEHLLQEHLAECHGLREIVYNTL